MFWKITLPCLCRDSIGAQLQLALAKADSEQLARSIAEEQLSDVEKEKTMLELELKEALSRHRDDLNKREITVTTVSDLHVACNPEICDETNI